MILQSIKLENFRQFKDELISFAPCGNKNVTIIIGENETGKTTFEQSFFWVLYGKTAFTDKVLLNKMVANEMTPGHDATVKVTLSLIHGEVTYDIIREQKYKKNAIGKIVDDPTVVSIRCKDRGGNTYWVKATACESTIKDILPDELSSYFFFDGERIEKMSKEITDGRSSGDFADAVKGLLGLNGMDCAIKHLNPRAKNSVIGEYNSKYNENGDKRIVELTTKIGNCNDRLTSIDAEIAENDSNVRKAKARKAEKEEELKQYKESEEIQQKIEDIETEQKKRYKRKDDNICALLQDFNANLPSFLSFALIRDSLHLLADKDFSGKDIPHINADTIQYLLKQGTCICGECLAEGSEARKAVEKLIDFIPPKSLSSAIGDFKSEARHRASNRYDLPAIVNDSLSTIDSINEDIDDAKMDEDHLRSKLKGNENETVQELYRVITECESSISKCETKKEELLVEKGEVSNRLHDAERDRKSLSLQTETNKKIEIYKAYAERIYDEINQLYSTQESDIRNKLQDTINDVFKRFYNGSMTLRISDKYKISVFDAEYDDGVEINTAQSVSAILAFIASIIKMARENKNSTSSEERLLSSEPYPLVMDAPWSTFDKKRIKNICESLPEMANQVVIFIKDTDGELAEQHLGSRVGASKRFEMISKYETRII